MPYLQANIPLRGWVTDVPFHTVPEGFSHDLFNVIPTDSFRRKVRLGTRPGFNRMYKFASGTSVQCLVRAVAFNGTPPTKRDRVFVVNAGKIYFVDPGADPVQVTDAALGTGAALNTSGRVEAVQRGQYLYFVDGTNYRKVDLFAAPPIWSAWSHPSHGPEDIVTNSVGGIAYTATLIALYGSRLVLAGVKRLENIWFMSSIEDPDHWGASATAGDPIAGNDGVYGAPGDEIIALIPFGQTGIMFAGAKSISYLNFDPAIDATQAALRQISRSVGIVGPRGWCYGPERTVYLMSQDGLYRLSPNDFNVDRGNRISLNKLDAFFSNIRWDDIDATLAYDVERRGVWIYLTRRDQPENSTHLFYSEQTDGFFPWRSYDPDFTGAFSATQMLTTDGRNQVEVFGSSSGQLGYFDQKIIAGIDGYVAPGYSTDRNPTTQEALLQKIESRMTIGPISADQPGLVMIKEAQVELGADEYLPDLTVKGSSERPRVDLLTAETAQEAVAEAINSVLVTTLYALEVDGGTASVGGVGLGYNGGDANDALTPPTTYLDGQYSYDVAQTYTTQDTFVDPLDRIYLTDNSRYELVRVDFSGTKKWCIQDEASTRPLFVQQSVAGVFSDDPQVGDYLYVITDESLAIIDTLDGTGQDKVGVKVQASTYAGLTTTILGNLREGVNNRMRCRVRAEAAFLRISSDGYPFAMERAGIDVNSAGMRRNVVSDP